MSETPGSKILGYFAMHYEGVYIPGQDYTFLSLVIYAGGLWLCIKKTGTVNVDPGSNDEVWVLSSTSAATIDKEAAQVAAGQAQESATQAAASANDANASKQAAQSAAIAAHGSASAAAGSEAAAAASKSAAESASGAAQGAQAAAEQTAANFQGLVNLVGAGNPNLLHNAYFRNPLNQRGVSSFSGSLSYGLDRWMSYGGTITVNDGYISFTSGAYLIQRAEGYHLMSKVVTGSVCLLDGTIVSGTVALPTTAGVTVAASLPSFGLLQMYFHNGCLNVEFIGGAVSIVAVKLEIGAVSTLHLDPPMDHAVELPKCQRYFQVIDTIPYGFCISGFGDNTATARLLYNAPVPFRGPITAIPSGVLPIAGASGSLTGVDVASISYALAAQNNSVVTLLCTATAVISAGTIHVGHYLGGRIALSSDL